MPVYFVSADQIREGTVTITGPLHHHLRTSLRYGTGDELWVADDQRRRYRIKVARIGPRDLVGDILDQREGPPRGAPSIVLGQALLKGERMDWIIQKATEFGTARLVPLVTAQTVVRPQEQRVATQHARWERIALEAAQQSERWDIPQIERPSDARAFFRADSSATARLILVEPSVLESARHGLSSVALPKEPEAVLMLAVGPEGGWREDELQTAIASGYCPVSLGSRVLRAETATVAALAVLQSRLGELG